MKLEHIGTLLQEIQPSGAVAVVTDSNVAPLYLDRCRDSLEEAGYRVFARVVPAGEESKSGASYLSLLSFLAGIPLTRSDGVVALGGGMIGDLAGFAAATYLRGINVYQVPTTLLAAVDSSVGGKTGIDLPEGKNLAGAFHQPALILQDPSLLETLPEDVYRQGMAEVIKYGVIEDAKFFARLTDPAWVRAHPEEVIRRCVEIKRCYVEQDERDRGVRHALNFGHTIGHAVEQLSGYRVSHGDAVAKGMLRIAQISAAQNWCTADVPQEIGRMLARYGFDTEIPYDAEQLFEALSQDKKRTGEVIRLVTPVAIGRYRIRPLPMEELRRIL
ncbi:MAG: 3-dehydroquinate synthase [Mogibacterium sp.]|nr:3-dehydroquinate synthase [Mogibacterium sp.]